MSPLSVQPIFSYFAESIYSSLYIQHPSPIPWTRIQASVTTTLNLSMAGLEDNFTKPTHARHTHE
ncbi:hypothetical protein PROFUN_06061 [Planoprotostelium fungivorum]|uniref:Uncharacterized protein n=1 Tax=Planoprotostelium fungivorum TaxID=1890364 RepID=A0A2P6NPQ9_9EUKA|nr:hypothetical protein PROFUN_06061 [Planoprotostelium fungivorum]